MVSPVAGFRPSRAAVSLTLNLPKPLREISSPPAAAWAIAANTASTVLRPSALLRPDSAASLSARSLLFMQTIPAVFQLLGDGLAVYTFSCSSARFSLHILLPTFQRHLTRSEEIPEG